MFPKPCLGLYILLYVEEQYSYDKHEDHASDIYRVTTNLKILGDHHLNATSSPPVAAAMKHDFAEVQQYTRALNAGIFGAEQHLLKYGEKSFYESQALFVDSPVNWWMFAIASVLAIGIALFTVSFQAIKAALANPVKSLKTE